MSSRNAVARQEQTLSTGIESQPRVSHALQHICGRLGEQIAEQIPFPHTPFLNSSAPVMHLCGMTITNPVSSNSNIRVLVNRHQHDWRDAAFIANPRFCKDNTFILKKMTLPLWDRADYRRLSTLLECPAFFRLAAHQKEITPEYACMVFNLPVNFRTAKIVGFLRHVHEAALVKKLFEDREPQHLQSIGKSLDSCADRDVFWQKISDWFFRGLNTLPIGPVIHDDRVSPVRTVRELERAGRKLRNCLRTFRLESYAGETGFFLYSGTEKAVISYVPRINGPYVIDEIQGPENNPVSDETLGEIRTIFTAAGFIMHDDEPIKVYRKIENMMNMLCVEDRPDDVGQICLKALSQLDQVPKQK